MFETSVSLACDSKRHERFLEIRYWFTSNHIPFRFGWPREASRLEAKTHEAEAKTHEAEAEAEATTHEAEAEAEARFFGLEAEARPRGLTSLHVVTKNLLQCSRIDNCLMVTGPLVLMLTLVKCPQKLVVYPGANVQPQKDKADVLETNDDVFKTNDDDIWWLVCDIPAVF